MSELNRNGGQTRQQEPAPQDSELTESSPNPHNEQQVTGTPVNTGHGDLVDTANVASVPRHREGKFNSSVADSVESAIFDDDSMFNNADPQTKAVRGKRSSPGISQEKDASVQNSVNDRKKA